jgi:hypothetical protein
MWYVTEVAIEQDTESIGVVRVGNATDATLWHVDSELFCEFHVLTRDCLPVKVVADHTICASQEMIRSMLPLTRAAKGREMRLRSIIHDVPQSEVLRELAKYGLSRDMLPASIGGTEEFGISEWIENRRRAETKETSILSDEEGNVDDLVKLDEDLKALLDE